MTFTERDLERLLTPKEAARRLRVHVATLLRWVDQGVVPAVKIGRRKRFFWPRVIQAIAPELTAFREELKQCNSSAAPTAATLPTTNGSTRNRLPSDTVSTSMTCSRT